MKISVDQDKCVSSGQCVLNATDLFDQRDDDGVAIVLDPTPGPEHHEEVREAAAVCPAAAIRLVAQ
jgi:ferredoxin